MSSRKNDGTELQDDLADALKEFTQTHKAFSHRFPDSKSAWGGNRLKPQPGDFMLLIPGQAVLIECKSTVVGARLISLAHHGDVGKRQIAKHRLWMRSGNPSLYLYGDLTQRLYEWHRGEAVVKKHHAPFLRGPLPELAESLPVVINYLKQEKEVESLV